MLLENGWKMQEINNMDMVGYLKLRAWKASRERTKKDPVRRFIDEAWPNMHP